MQEIMIASMSILVNILGMVQLPYGGPEGPKSGLLASDDLHLAHPHHLRPLRLHRQGGGAQVSQQLELQTIHRFSQTTMEKAPTRAALITTDPQHTI